MNPSIAAVLASPPSTESQPRQQITVVGFVRTVRNQKLRSFVAVGDGSTVHPLQAVLEPLHAKGSVSSECPSTVKSRLTTTRLDSLNTGTAVAIRGIWQHSPSNKEQKCELKAEEVTIIGSTDAEVSATFISMDERERKPLKCYKKTPINTLMIALSYPEEISHP